MLDMTAKDLMNKAICVDHRSTLKEVTKLFMDKMISGAPVIDDDGNLVGVISLRDLAANGGEGAGEAKDSGYFVRSQDSPLTAEEWRHLHFEDETSTKAKDIMTPVVFSVTTETPISDIARTMYRGRVHRLVVTEEDRLAGIITTMDLIKLLA